MLKVQMEFSAGGIVFKREIDKVYFALIHNSYGQWSFPKGHIEKGEKPEEAALREIEEEIGVSNLKVRAKIDKIDYWFKLEGILYHKYVYFYLIEAPTGSKIHPQKEEVADAGFFTQEECFKKLVYKDDPPLLKKAIKMINEGDFQG